MHLYAPGTHAGIVVLRLTDQRPAGVAAAVRDLLADHTLEEFAGCIVVIQPGAVRIRRPSI